VSSAKQRKTNKPEPAPVVNLLDLVPVHLVRSETDAEGFIVLLKPKFNNRWLRKYLLPRIRRPFFRITLDELGSFIWCRCDGKCTVRELAELHNQRFGEKAEPLLDRLSLFLQTLERNRFIRFEGIPSADNDLSIK